MQFCTSPGTAKVSSSSSSLGVRRPVVSRRLSREQQAHVSTFYQHHVTASLVVAAAAAEGRQQQEQQETDAQKQGVENHTRARVKRLSRSWEDSSTPNTGIVSITDRSKTSGAAACVAADFKTNRITRIVPTTPDMCEKAFDTVRLAEIMLNNNMSQRCADEGREHATLALVFQPVEVIEDLAAPPLMPLGAIVMYAAHLRADNEVLQDALSRRSAVVEAVEAASNDTSSLPDSTRRQQAYVSTKSDIVRVAGALNQGLNTQGWSELVSLGRADQTGPLVLQVLVKLRKIRYGRNQDDISVVVLGNDGVLGHAARSRQPMREGLRSPASFLLIRCTKNNSTKLTPLSGASEA